MNDGDVINFSGHTWGKAKLICLSKGSTDPDPKQKQKNSNTKSWPFEFF